MEQERARGDAAFGGSVADLYERDMVPLIFQPYADDMARRVAALAPARVLETAAGTGVVTRAMARALPATTDIVATDLNQPMLDRAARTGTSRPVRFQQCDALALPFEDERFDAVVCQFGAMFFPDRARGYAEARRVLRSGGHLLLYVWDRIEHNDFADTVTRALAERFPSDPPRFLARTPYGYHDAATIARDLAAGGFTATPTIETVTSRSRAASAFEAARAYCEGTPLRGEIEARDGSPNGLAEATSLCSAALARRFGSGAVEGKIQALVATVARA